MSAPKPAHASPPVNCRSVWVGPAPRSVMLPWPLKLIPPLIEYVPAAKETTCPGGHPAIAALIWLDVAPGFKVVQTVVRAGIPPGMPEFDQSIARLGSITPDHVG